MTYSKSICIAALLTVLVILAGGRRTLIGDGPDHAGLGSRYRLLDWDAEEIGVGRRIGERMEIFDVKGLFDTATGKAWYLRPEGK